MTSTQIANDTMIKTDSDSYQTGYVFAGQGGWNSRTEAARTAKDMVENFKAREFTAGWNARKGRRSAR